MTPVDEEASAASAAFAVGALRSATAAMTRARASVIRAGGLPVATRPNFAGSGVASSPARIAILSTMPRGLSVQRATQSMKSRNGARSGGQSRVAAIALRLSPPPGRTAQTTPVACRAPSGMRTNAPGSSFQSEGAR